MADRYIDIEIEGEEKIFLALERQENRQREEIRNIIDDLSDFATIFLIGAVPQYNNYIMNHIGRDHVTWMPGGAGGGGEWKSIVGVKKGSSNHPLYVEQGTGIYGGRGNLIYAAGVTRLTGKRQKVMVFEKRGEPARFRYWIYGQRGKRYFYLTWQALQAAARVRVLSGSIND